MKVEALRRVTRRDVGWLIREERGQATVEMAIVAPVLLVLALVVYNLMLFLAATARFDRVAPDVVLAHGVAPTGDAMGSTEASSLLEEQLRRAMEGYEVEVAVTVASEAREGDGLLSMVGAPRVYRCEMRFVPWPGNWSIAGVSLGAPGTLAHVREVAVDPWRSGVIV